MKTLNITLKDLIHNLRSPFILAFMFLLPLLQAGLPYLAFHGFSEELQVQTTRLQIVNLDRSIPEYPDFNAGALLIEMFKDETLEELLEVSLVEEEVSARQALEEGKTDVLVVIPANFTASLFGSDEYALIKIEHDPVLTLGPSVVRDVVVNFSDGFAGSLLAADVAEDQFAAHDQVISEEDRLDVMGRYGDWAQTIGESLEKGIHPAIHYDNKFEVQSSGSVMEALIGPLMIGMLVFFAFFVGAMAAQSILREREQGTLARLFETPTSKVCILAGKCLAVVILLGLQVSILLGMSSMLFGIEWGDVLALTANGLGLVLSAAGFGLLVISFMSTTRQAFLVVGGVVILTGMAGGTMTTTFSSLPEAFSLITLFTPQGWVIKGMLAALHAGTPAETLLPALVSTGFGLLCIFAGMFNFFRKYQ